MVRTTIACARCRASKVKCIHNGAPPCRGCVKAGRTEPGLCILSGPQLKRRGTPRRVQKNQNSIERQHEAHKSSVTATPTPAPGLGQASTLSLSDLLQTATLFMHKFPELGFLHRPTFSRDLKRDDSPIQSKAQLLGSALVVLCSPLTGRESEKKSVICDQISPTTPPNLYVVQALLVISMFEWGQGNVHVAWMYSGTAIRMMQLLDTIASKSNNDPSKYEVYNRTLWSCFIMDRLVFSGKHQALCLPLDTMNTHWPVSDTDYGFSSSSAIRHHVSCPFIMTMDYSFAILVRGFDIWAQVYHWVVSGGRRRKDMLLDENFPWEDTSVWKAMRRQLQEWRDGQDPSLWYPTNPVSISTSLGKGEMFGYINLIYYVSILFLHREYVPFLPWPTSTPRGPVDPPLLPSRAPDGWWETRAAELFDAASCITQILADLHDEGASLDTPFAAFCNFSAATMNIYISCFPSMNLNRSSDMISVLGKNLAYLDRFRSSWPIGKGWWTTVQQTKALYERHSQNPERYLGKTRDDFVGLEASIHDVTGATPTDLPEQEPRHPSDGEVFPEEAKVDNLPANEDWGYEWPLWYELHSMHFNHNQPDYL